MCAGLALTLLREAPASSMSIPQKAGGSLFLILRPGLSKGRQQGLTVEEKANLGSS